MSLKVKIGFLFVFFLSLTGLAQEEIRVIDSLQSIVRQQEGEERVVSMSELSRAFEKVSYEDCIYYGENAIVEAEKIKDNELMAWAHWKMGIRFMNYYEFDLALQHFEQADHLMIIGDRIIEDEELLMDVLNYKGRVELLMGELEKALKTYQRVVDVSEELDDKMNCADAVINLAYIYFHQDQLDKSMAYFEDARYRYIQLADTLSVAQCDNNISNIYVQWQQFDNAQLVLQQAIPVFLQYEDESSLAHAYQNLGAVYATGHVNLDSAMFYLRKSIECAESVDDRITLVEDEIELANVLIRLNRSKDAVSLYQSALYASEAIGYQNGILDAYRHLGIYYNEIGDYTTSAIYLKRCMDLAEGKGNLLYSNAVRPYLISSYAYLGYFAEMKKEMGLLQDDYEAVYAENNALSEELSLLQYNASGLFDQYESQSQQLDETRSKMAHYRLAFFGLLALVIAAIVFWVFRRILLYNRNRSK